MLGYESWGLALKSEVGLTEWISTTFVNLKE